MRALPIHLWREWREHRRSIYVLSACLALLVAGLSRLVPVAQMRDPVIGNWTMTLTLTAVVISIGSDLFANERQRGTAEFLGRVPGGLSGAFTAKLAFFVALLLGAVGYGTLLAGAAVLSRTGTLPDSWFKSIGDGELAAISCVLLWIFTVSTWVKSGALTVPATALFLGVVGMPGVLMMQSGRFSPTLEGLFTVITLAAVGALVCARLSFVRSGRRPRWSKHGRRTSFIIACLFFTPAWAWAGYRYLETRDMRAVQHVLLGEDQRFAYVTLGHRWKRHSDSGDFPAPTALRIDLKNGEVVRVGPLDRSTWGGPRPLSRAWDFMNERGWPVVELHELDGPSPEVARTALFDGKTGLPLQGEPACRANSFWRELGWPEGFELDGPARSFRRAGDAYSMWTHDEGDQWRFLYWDPAAESVVDLEQLCESAGEEPHREARGCQGRWLAQTRGEQWHWIDPSSGECEVVDSLEQGDEVCASFDDGSLLVVRDDKPLRLWPITGEMIELEARGLPDGAFHVRFDGQRAPLSSEVSSASSAWTWSGRHSRHVVVIDPVANEIRAIAEHPGQHSSAGAGFALFTRGRQLLQLDSATGRVRVLLELGREIGSIADSGN